MARRAKVEYPLTWWWLFARLPRTRHESRTLYFEKLGRSRSKTIYIPEVQETPAVAAPPPAPTTMANPRTDQTEKAPPTPANTTSASSDKKQPDIPKETPTPPNPLPTKKQKRKEKLAKAQQASSQAVYHKEAYAKGQSPAKRRSEEESDTSPPRVQSAKRNHTSVQAKGAKRVQFAMDVKKEDAGSRTSFRSCGSSNKSWIDPPPIDSPTVAGDRKSSFKSKRDAGVSDSAFNHKLTKTALAELDFDDLWSDHSDGEGSAIDINDVPSAAAPRGSRGEPALRGILKTRGQSVPRSRDHAYATARKQSNTAAQSRAKQTSPNPLTSTFKDLERAKRSGYDSATVHAIGRENHYRSSSKTRNQRQREASPRSWNVGSEFGSAVDYGRSRSKAREDAQDDRIDDALEQAWANSNLNKRTPSGLSSSRSEVRPRSALKSTQHQTSTSAQSPSSNSERLWQSNSSRPEPILIFRPSDSKENEPDIIVHTQAELDAARRDYYRRRNSSPSASQYTN